MPKDASERCNALTTKGERCRNLSFTRGLCRLHAAEGGRSASERVALVTAVISSGTAAVTLVEKLVGYWPDILLVIERIIASGSDPGWREVNTPEANAARLQRLKSSAAVSGFSILLSILEGHGRASEHAARLGNL